MKVQKKDIVVIPAGHNFPIIADGKVSTAFRERGITDFSGAIEWVTDLPYGRNADKQNPVTVFDDGCGTCGTKHALLKQLADENSAEDVQLILCVFKMSRENTPSIKTILDKYGLPYMPEAHNYLRVGGEIVDATKRNWSVLQFLDDVIWEQEIQPDQITGFKVSHHKHVLSEWLAEHPEIPYTLTELYAIREQCIAALGSKR